MKVATLRAALLFALSGLVSAALADEPKVQPKAEPKAETKAPAPKRPVPPESVGFEPDIEYGRAGDVPLLLNLARPKTGEGPFPAVVCIHGGGFRAGTREGWNARCIRLAEKGYVAITVEYRLAPKHPFPAAVHDCKAAVRWLRANAAKYKVNPEAIAVAGDSAGGHLSQFLGVTGGKKEFEGDCGHADQSSKVQAVINFYGPADLVQSMIPGKSVDAAKVLPLWLGDLETNKARYVEASPITYVGKDSAPTLILHGTKDTYVAYEQSPQLIEKLKAAGVDAELVTLEGAGHGFKGDDAAKAEAAMLAFLAKHLRK
jgi:acetyl esterase/lipase